MIIIQQLRCEKSYKSTDQMSFWNHPDLHHESDSDLWHHQLYHKYTKTVSRLHWKLIINHSDWSSTVSTPTTQSDPEPARLSISDLRNDPVCRRRQHVLPLLLTPELSTLTDLVLSLSADHEPSEVTGCRRSCQKQACSWRARSDAANVPQLQRKTECVTDRFYMSASGGETGAINWPGNVWPPPPSLLHMSINTCCSGNVTVCRRDHCLCVCVCVCVCVSSRVSVRRVRPRHDPTGPHAEDMTGDSAFQEILSVPERKPDLKLLTVDPEVDVRQFSKQTTQTLLNKQRSEMFFS